MHGARVQNLVDWARVQEFVYAIMQNVVVSNQLKNYRVNYKTVLVSR